MTKQYRSPAMASIHETAEGLHAAGLMDKQTMRRFDEACLTPEQNREAATTPPLTMRDALHGIWQADKYPIRGNEDWRIGARLDAEALERAATAVMSPGDRSEFAEWIAALRRPDLPADERDEIMYAIHDLFEAEG